MQWKNWLLGAVALLVFDALLVYGVRSYRSSVDSPAPAPAPALGQKADILSASPKVARRVPPFPKPMQSACVAGETWFFNDVAGRWFKPVPSRTCKLGTVRTEDDREGLIVRHPKGWRPNLPNLTQ